MSERNEHREWADMMQDADLAYGSDGRIWHNGAYPVTHAEAETIIDAGAVKRMRPDGVIAAIFEQLKGV